MFKKIERSYLEDSIRRFDYFNKISNDDFDKIYNAYLNLKIEDKINILEDSYIFNKLVGNIGD